MTPLGAQAPVPAGMILDVMLERFLEARAKSKRNKSVKDDRERSRPLLAFFGKDTPISMITTARVREYRLHRQGVKSRRGRLLSSTTINRECQVLRGAFNLAFADEEVAKVSRFTMESESPRERWMTEDECIALVAATQKSKTKMLAPMVVVALHTGLRYGELVGLTWQEIDMARSIITLEGSRTKSGKSREVPINGDVYAVLAPLRSDAGGQDAKGSVWGGVDDIDTAFRCAVKRAGLETTDLTKRVTFHTLRHTFASLSAQRGTSLLDIQQMLGHASYRTTEKTYTRLAPGFVVGKTSVLEGLGVARINASSTHGPSNRLSSVETSREVCDTPSVLLGSAP